MKITTRKAAHYKKKDKNELTTRERQIFLLICRDRFKTWEIANIFNCSIKTVNTHLGSIYKKYNVDHKIELIARYYEEESAVEKIMNSPLMKEILQKLKD